MAEFQYRKKKDLRKDTIERKYIRKRSEKSNKRKKKDQRKEILKRKRITK
jgi:hypothetical protein